MLTWQVYSVSGREGNINSGGNVNSREGGEREGGRGGGGVDIGIAWCSKMQHGRLAKLEQSIAIN